MSGITKLWVRRPNSSPTRIQIPSSVSTPDFSPTLSGTRDTPRPVDVELTEDFLVDDLRDMILRKFPQSLGKHHDSADLSIQIPKRNGDPDGEGGRILAPDESVMKILTEEYPNGQKSTDAWTVITTGGRDNYTRWWLQTGGLSTDIPIRPSYSPNPYIPSTGGSYGSEMYNQEYFPYIPQTVVTPPGEFPPRSRASGSSMMSAGQFPRTQGRPPLRPSRTTALQEGLFPQRRYDATGTSSLVAEIASAPDSEHSQQGRGSPDPNILPNALRYPPNIRANNSTGRNTPPGEYPTRARQYTAGKQPPTSAPFQTQPPIQPLPAIPQKPQSPLGGPPPPLQQQQQQQQQQRLSTGTAVRPTIISSPNPPPEKPPQQKDGTSPKSPVSGTSSNSGGTSNSPVTRRKSNTISNQPIPIPRSPSPVAERTEPRPIVPLVQAKVEKELPTANKTSAIGVIPPINVLIVEDNFINAQILEAFFRKRKLKYATAVNGKEAVEKWRQGGWHLVLMDIQLPVMSGIEATKEIRRLERVNHIGVFTDQEKPCAEDELGDLPFPSPVIIVALTASSRESDRNEALAAGCNDFLTKPVGAPWLERKAIEWGCMQALIYTSFERKKRRAETLRKALEDGIELPPEVHMLVEKKKKEAEEEEKEVSKSVGETSATSAEADKPPVLRNESEESVQTHTSEDTDEAQT